MIITTQLKNIKLLFFSKHFFASNIVFKNLANYFIIWFRLSHFLFNDFSCNRFRQNKAAWSVVYLSPNCIRLIHFISNFDFNNNILFLQERIIS